MLSIRPLIFWIFVTLFSVTAFSAVFYAFGYRFNFERGIFIYTGSISIKSNPQTVAIRIDNAVIPEKKLGILNNSILISGLTPGEHLIEVTADGYLPWSKKALVQSGLSTEFWNVLLAKENASPQEIPGTDAATKIFPAPDQSLFAVAKTKDGTLIVDALDTDTGDSEPVASLTQASLPANGENIEWSPDNRRLIIPFEQDGLRAYSVVNVRDKRLTALQQPTPQELSLSNPRWDSTTNEFLFFLLNTKLYRADTETPEEAPFFIKDRVRAYDISGSTLYYLNDDNGIIYRIPANRPDAEPTQITTVPIDIDQSDTAVLVVYDETRIAVRTNRSGKLWIYNAFSSSDVIFRPLAESGVTGVQFSNDGKKLLFFTDNEISVYFTSPWEAQPIRGADTTTQIARFSNAIGNVQWTKDYEHILFTSNGGAKIVELDNRDRRNIASLVSFSSPLIQVLSRFEDNRIYFVTETGSLTFIEFPTPQNNIFGF